MSPDRAEDKKSADAKASDRGEGRQVQCSFGNSEVIGDQNCPSAEHSENVQPQWRAQAGQVPTESNLQQQCGEADCRDDHQRHWTHECAAARVHHDQRERQNQQAGSDHRPAPLRD